MFLIRKIETLILLSSLVAGDVDVVFVVAIDGIVSVVAGEDGRLRALALEVPKSDSHLLWAWDHTYWDGNDILVTACPTIGSSSPTIGSRPPQHMTYHVSASGGEVLHNEKTQYCMCRVYRKKVEPNFILNESVNAPLILTKFGTVV